MKTQCGSHGWQQAARRSFHSPLAFMDARRTLFRLHFSGNIVRSAGLTFRNTSKRDSVISKVCEPLRTRIRPRSFSNRYSQWPGYAKRRQAFFVSCESYAINAESFLFSTRFRLVSDVPEI